MDVVFARLWDLCEDSCDKLEDIKCFSIGMRVEWVFTRTIGFVEEVFGAGSPMDAGEADGATKQIGGQPYEPVGVFGPNRDGAIDGKSATPECV